MNDRSPTATRNDPQPTQSLRDEIRAHLVRSLRSLNDEIGGYPKPIPRCDAQFNHLYEQRARLMDDLHALDTFAAAAEGGLLAWIRAYLDARPHTETAQEQRLRDHLRAELGKHS
jgi:hypothetical protein